jgi:ferredoxin-type protein NapF
MSARAESIDRTQFLRGQFRAGRSAIRPPWHVAERQFVETCERCDKCADACPENIIGKGGGGFPEVSFENGECTFCGDCVRACPSGALDQTALADPGEIAPWTIRARISESCISAKGVTCRVCGDFCEAGAIRFRLAVGGDAVPEIDTALCTGCGACVAPCPVNAVRID